MIEEVVASTDYEDKEELLTVDSWYEYMYWKI